MRKGNMRQGGHVVDEGTCDAENQCTDADNAQGLLPLLVVLLSETDVLSKHIALPTHASPTSPPKESAAATEQHFQSPSFRVLAVITVSASLALSTGFTTSPTFALGVSSVIFAAVGFVLFEQALRMSNDDGTFYKSPQISANGSPSRSGGPSDGSIRRQQLVVFRDVAVVMAAVCGLAAYFMEPRITSSIVSWEPIYRFGGGSVKTVRHYKTVQLVLVLVLVNTLINAMTFLIVRLSFSHPDQKQPPPLLHLVLRNTVYAGQAQDFDALLITTNSFRVKVSYIHHAFTYSHVFAPGCARVPIFSVSGLHLFTGCRSSLFSITVLHLLRLSIFETPYDLDEASSVLRRFRLPSSSYKIPSWRDMTFLGVTLPLSIRPRPHPLMAPLTST